jgi:hypothetical protein
MGKHEQRREWRGRRKEEKKKKRERERDGDGERRKERENKGGDRSPDPAYRTVRALVNCAAYRIIHWYCSALYAQSQWKGGYRTHRRQSRHGAHRNLPVSYEMYHTVLYRLRLCMACFFLLFVVEGGGGSTSSRVSQPTGYSTAVKECRQRMPSKNAVKEYTVSSKNYIRKPPSRLHRLNSKPTRQTTKTHNLVLRTDSYGEIIQSG